MQYFRNFELANMFNVSQAAVGKWITAAKNGKLDVRLMERDGKTYITNTPSNLAAIEKMVKERKKYFNKRSLKVVKPTEEFYKTYSKEQILDIISNIDIHREIPLQYTYFEGGANYWDQFMQSLSEQEMTNMLTGTMKLFKVNEGYIEELIGNHKHVNVIDIGVGNGYPVKGLLQSLVDKGVMGRYVALDISEEMLTRAERNIQRWFGDKIKMEKHVRDINYDRFVDVLVPSSFDEEEGDAINLVLLLGGTLNNFRSPHEVLGVIYNSLGKNSYFIHSGKLDTPNSRLYFDLSIQPEKPVPQYGTSFPTVSAEGTFIHGLVVSLLGIDESLYEVERVFNETSQARYICIKFNVAVSIHFTFDGIERHVDLGKGETITLWRYWHFTPLAVIKLLDKSKFKIIHASTIDNGEYILSVSQIQKVRQSSSLES